MNSCMLYINDVKWYIGVKILIKTATGSKKGSDFFLAMDTNKLKQKKWKFCIRVQNNEPCIWMP